jgi:small membrane protein
MELIQIIIIIFALFALSRAILQLNRKGINLGEFLFWFIVWTSLIIFTFIPQLSVLISNIFGIARGVDLFIYVSIVSLFYIIFRIYVSIEKMKSEITLLTREIAINRAKSPIKKKK